MSLEETVYKGSIADSCELDSHFNEFLQNFEESNREFLISCAENLIDIGMESGNEKMAHMLLTQIHYIKEDIDKRFNGNTEEINKFLANLYRLTTAFLLDNLVEALQEVALNDLFINLSKEKFAQTDKKDKQNLLILVRKILMWRNITKAFSLRNKFPEPFSNVDLGSVEWNEIVEEAENFSHSISRNYNLDGVFQELEYALDMNDPDCLVSSQEDLKIQNSALPAFLNLLNSFKGKLLKNTDTEVIDNFDLVIRNIIHLLNSRQANDPDQELPIPLPIKFTVERGTELFNADKNEIMRAIFEIAKGAYSVGKIDKNQLGTFDHRKSPYQTIDIQTFKDEQGREGICIEIADFGTPLPEFLEEQANEHGIDLINYVSDRGVTFARNGEDAEYVHKGIGLNSARKTIRRHNGDISVQNLPRKEGVKFTILIPKDGQESTYAHSFGEDPEATEDSNPLEVQLEVIYDLHQVTE